MRLRCVLIVSSILTFSQSDLALAQSDPQTSTSNPSCTFSCPPTNLISWSLAKRPYTVGFNSFYSIFECVYATLHPTVHDVISEHKCTYNKYTGVQALEAIGDNCPPQAIPCPEPSSSESNPGSETTPLFSHIDEEEVVPWVEGGRFLLYLKEHPPG